MKFLPELECAEFIRHPPRQLPTSRVNIIARVLRVMVVMSQPIKYHEIYQLLAAMSVHKATVEMD
ncbi:MAG: hypothetical protein R3E08_12615 [Thiotrichaceae bacterium]